MTATAHRKWERPDDEITLTIYTLRRLLKHTAPLLTLAITTPLGEIAVAMRRAQTSVAIIVDGDRGFVGTLAFTQLAAALADRATTAAAYISGSPVTLDPEDDLDDAAAAFAAKRVEHVLVVSASGELLGAISEAELQRAVRR